MDLHKIRNFSIIAHVDHGKSTLADRLMEFCGASSSRGACDQILDSMDIERERGITIKSQTVRLMYDYPEDGQQYVLNLMDTPGHVDFSYEVSRSLAACEGSILLVDAAQGVEAQTVANAYKAVESDHVIIPVLNKVDLASADPSLVTQQISETIGIDVSSAVMASAKVGTGIDEILSKIVEFLPPPSGDKLKPLQALLVDSWYDVYLGVVILVRIIDGCLSRGSKVVMMSNKFTCKVEEVGVFTPDKLLVDKICAGEIGFFTAAIKDVSLCKVGDTITNEGNQCADALPGFKRVLPVVFCSIFPSQSDSFASLKDAIAKLHLNDSSFSYEVESSSALGLGFRCGFLGMLHLDVIQERLEREFNVELTVTAPGVVYKVVTRNGEILWVSNPREMPSSEKLASAMEPWVLATVIAPEEYLGPILGLLNSKRGEEVTAQYQLNSMVLRYKLPLVEIVFDFYDRLKSLSRGYASFDWEICEYRDVQVVNLEILINSEPVDALSFLVNKDQVMVRGRVICEKLKNLIPRQQYKVAIQAVVGSKIIARETVNPYRKDVTAKLYGGDVTRRMKLLEKQKKGKKRLKAIGNVNIPHDAFVKVLKLDD